MNAAAPLVVARALRVAASGSVVLDAVDLETRGGLLVLAGDAGTLVSVLSGLPANVAEATERARLGEIIPLAEPLRVASGSLSVMGKDVAAGAHHGVLGFAPLDPPIEHDRTVGDRLEASVRLALARRGRASRADVTREMEEALGRAGIGGGLKRRMGTLALPERRTLELAIAASGGAEVVLVDRPLEGLEGQAAAFVLAALERAMQGRRAIVRVGVTAPGSPDGDLARRATDCAVFAGQALAFFGRLGDRPAGERVVRVTVRRGGEALCGALAEAGLVVTGGPERLSIALPEGRSPAEILRVAAAVRASVVEMVPVM